MSTPGEKFDALVEAVDEFVAEHDEVMSVTLPNGYVLVRDATQRYDEVRDAEFEVDRLLRDLATAAANIVHVADSVRALKHYSERWRRMVRP